MYTGDRLEDAPLINLYCINLLLDAANSEALPNKLMKCEVVLNIVGDIQKPIENYFGIDDIYLGPATFRPLPVLSKVR